MQSFVVLDVILPYIKLVIELVGVAVITCGALRATYQLCGAYMCKASTMNYIRFELGMSIILGLEFMVGADIVGSLVSPNYYTIGILAIVVVIRTVLSYFLNQELEQFKPEEQKAYQNHH